jgi:hypothetical protein
MKLHRRPGPNGERGATAVIVALSLIALLGLIVLTVDVGQLLFKRRAMVNASDAGALAAAQACAGVNDSDVPEAMSDVFASANASGVISGLPNIVEMVGCDGPSYGYVTVEYTTNQDLFFAGVLGADGPATVRTRATAGWGPAGAANPMPIVVYTGSDQGDCDIRGADDPDGPTPPGEQCYLWYDNDMFNQSAFGFLNLCTAEDAAARKCSQQGWDVGASDSCPNVGASERDDWINGDWDGQPNEVRWPDVTYVCRVSGLTTSNWGSLSARALAEHVAEGDTADLIFPVNDCTKQVDSSGTAIGCNPTEAPDKYAIIGFIVLHLRAVLDSKAEWEGASGSCQAAPMNMNSSTPNIDLDLLAPGLGCSPYDVISNVRLKANGNPKCCTEGTHYTYDPDTHVVDWIGGTRDNVTLTWDYALGGPCGVPPGNDSAVCIQVETVEVRFGGDFAGGGADFGLRAVRLCDNAYGSCPQDD